MSPRRRPDTALTGAGRLRVPVLDAPSLVRIAGFSNQEARELQASVLRAGAGAEWAATHFSRPNNANRSSSSITGTSAEDNDPPDIGLMAPTSAQLLLQRAYKNGFAVLSTRVVHASTSKDGSTTKLLVELADGHRVETVIIRHGAATAHRPQGEARTTLCVSSQIGCRMACSFCATGTMGEVGDLCAGEILEQLVHARRFGGDVRNVVFMGMGEPFNNYDAVVAAVRSMIDQRLFRLSPNRVTVSTVGIVPKILQFARDLPNVNLALSLHAPTQDLRATFVPAARAYPLSKLMEAVHYYLEQTGRRVLMEYVVLADLNDSEEVARDLGKLLTGLPVTLNLIPFNPVNSAALHQTPSSATVARFKDIMIQEFAVQTTVRREMGRDIAGACGQLVVQDQAQRGKRQRRFAIDDGAEDANIGARASDIEDIGADGAAGGEQSLPKPVVTSGALWPQPERRRKVFGQRPQQSSTDIVLQWLCSIIALVTILFITAESAPRIFAGDEKS